MSIVRISLEEFDDEMARTRKVLAAIPAECMDWQIDEKMNSVGWNANHITETVSWTKLILELPEFDIAPVDGHAHKTPSIEDPAEVLKSFDQFVVEARQALEVATDDVLSENWELKMGGQTLESMLKGACVRKWVLNHSIHHRAILSMYLRLRGVDIVPVYDE